MTLVVAIKCKHEGKDCIYMISDDLLTNGSLWTDSGTKIYAVPEMERGPGMIGLAGVYNTFPVATKIFKENFVEMKNNVGVPILVDKEECRSLVQKCSNKFHAWIVEQEQERKKEFDQQLIHGIFCTTVENNRKKELGLFEFDPYGFTQEKEYLAVGVGDTVANLVNNQLGMVMEHIGVKWSDLSLKLVGQIMDYVMNFAYENNAGIGKPKHVASLTVADGCKSDYSGAFFFPRHYNEGMPWKDEVWLTIQEELPADKVDKLWKIFAPRFKRA